MSLAVIHLDAEHRVQQIENKAVNVCFALRADRATVDERDEYVIVTRNALIGQPNPATGKPHSATSAEEAVKLTDEYKRLDGLRRNAECHHIMAVSDYERAVLNARIAVAALRGGE